ncbi:hypothetical protein DQT32_26845 [Salmonella enterica subsp. enterica serovar Braenderup]|uniref:Uncharacterized protein n=1 Tax=Salmonella enterica subsp. enterica serovar Bareilly TaxID=58096 RepID=A0A600JJ20_SALET|nr:hypothetical protein [Salmonella enterica subsp. enterica serovar Idikan]EAA6231353.1 hypothetical protein [Salmonella enterica subsp. enterica serovar Typhimurium]EAB9051235.1 hypothetical protein [Salmonella enterica subsp. enterica serovar Oranienburg]EAR3351422.1 hypothetical protein [Salmonella enterica]EBC9519955.1 hypothetical protein [Salmonella enterica subsp. enterica serovar Corvallis]EBQ9291891.1 hypothetical protein [Salmonella enterica subsp. enterica serovar Ohio]EBS1465029.
MSGSKLLPVVRKPCFLLHPPNLLFLFKISIFPFSSKGLPPRRRPLRGLGTPLTAPAGPLKKATRPVAG